MKFPFSVLLAMSLIACGEEEPKEEVDPLTVDDDGDGFSEEQGDCDDTNADLSPSATEICDEIDNDCDGDIDDADSSVDLSTGSVFYADADADTFGDANTEIEACVLPEGAVENMDDCDDDNADVNPDATEICDEIDNDCDANIDDADDSLDTSTGSTFYTDSDGDGEGDADASVMACTLPEGAVENMTDCDDTDAALNTADVDADGFTTCADADGFVDCDDTGATDLTNSSLDGDCDGTLTADDCDDADAMSTIMADDMDCDGLLPVDNGGTDCDDMDAAVGATDVDGDGSLACVDDCDDNDANLYPGVAFNEADTTLCVADADGDGYANYASALGACVDIEVHDTYGDGWNGNQIEVYEDGALTGTYENQNLDGASNWSSGGETQVLQHCFDSATVSVDFVFVDGLYNTEVQFAIMDGADETVLGAGEGSGSTDIIWEGTTFTDGDTFYTVDPTTLGETMGMTGGSDCDDDDATTFGDDDGDGYTYCTVDCDDTDIALNGDDFDGDGYSTCDGDCDDTASSCDDGVSTNETDCTAGSCDDGACDDGVSATETDCSAAGAVWTISTNETDCTAAAAIWTAGGVWTAGGTDFNPGMTETWYDGIDSDCDGANDFDQDGDGYEPIEYDDGTGTMIAHGGLDCRDDSTSFSAYYAPLAMEADATACYYDYDGDGYGDSTPSTTATGYNVVAGTDCYDSSDVTYPGAAYMDSTTECMEDTDGDGYGDVSPYSSSWGSEDYAVAGTDCEDDDEYTYPGAGYLEAAPLDTECLTDADEDGYAAMGAVTSYYSVAVLTGDCFDVTIDDSWGDGCNGTADMYLGVTFDTAIAGPSGSTVTTQWCASADGTLNVGWTEASSYNSECSFSIADATGTEVYASSGTIAGMTVEMTDGGTDADDSDSTVW